MANKSEAQIDTRQFESAFDRLMDRAKLDMPRHLDAIGEQVTGSMVNKVPRASGELADSIGHEASVDARGPYVEVFAEKFYASFVEWGTRFTSARPFFRPSLQEIPRLIQRFRRLF